MISTHCGTAMEFLPHTQHVAHFYCQCSPIGNQYRGSLSQILSDPLSTIPLLHLVNANVTILVELKNCLKLKLSLDVTELLLQRAMSSANVDFVLKVTFYFHWCNQGDLLRSIINWSGAPLYMWYKDQNRPFDTSFSDIFFFIST